MGSYFIECIQTKAVTSLQNYSQVLYMLKIKFFILKLNIDQNYFLIHYFPFK